ncbi:hypothetical protein CK203_090815 [Vitis vinifera]|uniref:Integrase zinc-binding domain-containing protein n=1 Tax=Vitis vinifera TaxID=29760 RepID=A0A438D4S8_VITVI|nr:hypothetical protein CK203_090815 [Vitis vinifera]
MGNQRRSIPLPFTKGAETCLLCQQALADVETRYSKMELTALALRSAAKSSAPIFKPPSDCTDRPPLRSILHKPDLTGRMLQWAIELSEFGIEFQPRLSKKGQVMADFVLEYSRRPDQHHESSEQEWWTLRVDGASRSSGSGVGLLLQSPTGEHLEQPSGWDSPRLTMKQNTRPSCPDWTSPCAIRLQTPIYSDSQLVVRHVQKEYEAKDSRMARYLAKVRSTLQQFTEWTIEKIKRADNGRADAWPNISGQELYPKILKSAQNPGASCPFHPDWGHLYKRSFTGPYLRCLGHSEAQYVLAELHEGICGNHTGGRSLAHRAHSQGYYWPTMKKDAAAYVQNPMAFRAVGHGHSGTPPSSTCPKKFLLVATDYFSKWVEAEAYASIKDKDHCIQEFLFGIEYPEFILHATLSSKQWPGGSHKQNSNQCLKEKAEQAKGKWVEELPGVLWAYRTTPGRPTGNTPFALTYGMDAVIPTEIGLPTIRTDAAKQKDANTELGRNLDWADEVRESASIRMADYQQRASAHYNRKVRPRNFKNGTLVLRKVFENTAEVGAGNSKPIGKDPT